MQRERREQEITVQWFKLKYRDILIVASANGGSRDVREARNLKKSGVLAGIPDLQVFKACRGYHGLLIEMKAPATNTTKRGSLTKLQEACLEKLNDEGYYAVPAWGFEEARVIINWYLGGLENVQAKEMP